MCVPQPWQLSLLSFVGTSAALCASVGYGVLFNTVSARAAFMLTATFSAAASVSQVLAVQGTYQVGLPRPWGPLRASSSTRYYCSTQLGLACSAWGGASGCLRAAPAYQTLAWARRARRSGAPSWRSSCSIRCSWARPEC